MFCVSVAVADTDIMHARDRGECVMPLNEIPKNESIARTCAAIDRVRLSRAATRYAIERSRKSLHETQALLVVLRNIYSGDGRRLTPTTRDIFA